MRVLLLAVLCVGGSWLVWYALDQRLPEIPLTVDAAGMTVPSRRADSGELFRIRRNGKYGYIDSTGRVAIEPVYCESGDFAGDLAPARPDQSGPWGYIDRSGAWIIKPSFSLASEFASGLAWVRTANGKYGYIDGRGSFVIQPRFDSAHSFGANGLAIVATAKVQAAIKNYLDAGSGDDYRYYWIDRTGKRVGRCPNPFQPVPGPGTVYPRSSPHGFGFVDQAGSLVIPAKFQMAYPFSEGLAPVQIAGRWGCIDTTGTVVIEPRFNWVYGFKNGLCEVAIDGKAGYIDRSGNWVYEPTK